MRAEECADGCVPSKNPNAEVCSDAYQAIHDCSILQDPLWFGVLCRFLWPAKPWLMLVQLAGIKERTAHNYASGTHPPPASVLVALLRSAEGFRVLRYIMDVEPHPQWWLVIQYERRLAALAKDIFARLGEVVK